MPKDGFCAGIYNKSDSELSESFLTWPYAQYFLFTLQVEVFDFYFSLDIEKHLYLAL